MIEGLLAGRRAIVTSPSPNPRGSGDTRPLHRWPEARGAPLWDATP